MELYFQISGYVNLVLLLAMMIIALTWYPRQGKWLLCCFAILSFTASLIFRIMNLWKTDSAYIEYIYVFGNFLFLAGDICLLCYLILLRGKPSCPAGDTPLMNNMAQPAEPGLQLANPELSGIGGWLILPAIGLILSPIMYIVFIVLTLTGLENAAEQGYGGYIGLCVTVQCCLLVFIVVVAFYFFGKQKAAPRLMIILMITNLVLSVILLLAAFGTGEGMFIAGGVKDLAKGIIGSLIWIPYFLISKRVKATFVR